MTSPTNSPTKRRRWGVRTLAFLALALLAVLVSGLQGHYTALTATMLLVGFAGAAVSSVRGVMTW